MRNAELDSVVPEDSVTRNPHSAIETLDAAHFWHSFTQMGAYEPLVVERAEGVWLHTTNGQRLLDGASSMWCNVHGHNHPTINAAIRGQLDRVAHSTSLGMGCDTTVRLAKRLADTTPSGLSRVLFSSDGSSAIEVALKAAFQFWQQSDRPEPNRTKFLAFGQAYHGDTIGAASVGGIDRFHALFTPMLFDAVRAPSPNRHVLPNGVTPGDATSYYLEQTASLFAEYGESLAAAVIEPLVQCAAGMVMHPPGFLRGLRKLCDEHGVLLILDEIAVGFGKTGALFACEQEDVTPDFLCLGKGLTGGYLPMAATVTTDRVYEAFLGDLDSGRQLYHGHTFCGNPLAAAAALACLDVFEQEETIANLQPKITRLGERFDKLADRPEFTSVRQAGVIAAADFAVHDGAEPIGREVARAALKHGVWLRPQPSMLYVMPPLSITLDEIDFLMDAIEASVDAVAN